MTVKDVPFGKSVGITFGFEDSAKGVASVDGTPVVTSTLGTVTVVPNTGDDAATKPFKAILTIGAVGTATLSGTADADLGEGIKTLAFPFLDADGSEWSFNGLASPEAAAAIVGSVTIE